MNHEECDRLGKSILAHFGQRDVIRYSIGGFDGNWQDLKGLVDQWWEAVKVWAAQDTLVDAYKEQRLTVKGTSEMNLPIQAHTRPLDPQERYAPNSDWGDSAAFRTPIVKTNASILARLNPDVFMPGRDVASQKTELGYHDLSALLLNPNAPISAQQYKTPEPDQTYVFMPLSYALDQAVFQNINTLAKACREQEGDFYNTVRTIRSQMTRIKLAAEHDMAVAFVNVAKPTERPKFKYTLISQTDISRHDEVAKLVPKDTFKCKLTTPRFEDALKGANLKKVNVESLNALLKKADLFDKEYLPEEFRRRVEQWVAPATPKSKWTKVEPLPEEVVLGKEIILEKIAPKTKQNWPTTPGILQARQNAAINFQSLVLGQIMRYAEVTIAYRKHPGLGEHFFPKFAKFDKQRALWLLGNVNAQNDWTATNPEKTFPDRPV